MLSARFAVLICVQASWAILDVVTSNSVLLVLNLAFMFCGMEAWGYGRLVFIINCRWTCLLLLLVDIDVSKTVNLYNLIKGERRRLLRNYVVVRRRREHAPSNPATMVSVKCGIAECGMRKVKCGTDRAEKYRGMVCNLRNAENHYVCQVVFTFTFTFIFTLDREP